MSKNRGNSRDRFAFSLRGLAATASFGFACAIADDGINRAWDRKLRLKAQMQDDSASHDGPVVALGQHPLTDTP